MILVVNTNSNTCRLYHYHKHPAALTLIKELCDPSTRLKSSELAADKPGHYQSGPSARGAFSPHLEAKENEIHHFSQAIAKELNQTRNQHGFDKLIVIAPPHMLGLLSEHLDKQVKNLITHHFQKDLLHLSDRELLDYLQTHAKYSEQ